MYSRVLPLAFGAAISPTILATAVLVLSAEHKAVARGALYALGTIVLVVFGVRQLLLPPRPSTPNHAGGEGVAAAFVLGLVMMLTNFTSLMLYLPAMKDIAWSGDPTSDKIVVTVVALFITSLAATLPLALRVVAPGPATTILGDVNQFVTRHQRGIVVIVAFVFGAYLTTRGLHDL